MKVQNIESFPVEGHRDSEYDQVVLMTCGEVGSLRAALLFAVAHVQSSDLQHKYIQFYEDLGGANGWVMLTEMNYGDHSEEGVEVS